MNTLPLLALLLAAPVSDLPKKSGQPASASFHVVDPDGSETLEACDIEEVSACTLAEPAPTMEAPRPAQSAAPAESRSSWARIVSRAFISRFHSAWGSLVEYVRRVVRGNRGE